MELAQAIAGIALVLFGIALMVLGTIGLAALVINQLPHNATATTQSLGINVPSPGDLLAAIFKAIAKSPAYAVALGLGLVLIFLGTLLLGVTYEVGSVCITLGTCPSATPSPSVAPSLSPSLAPSPANS